MQSVKERLSLAGKVAIVTGASKGIGEAIAHALAEFGARVVVSSRKQEAVDGVAQAIKQRGFEAAAVSAHMGDMEQARGLVDRAVAHYGGVDILVNNAATNPVFGPILDADEGVFDKIFSVNVKGPLEIAKRAFPVMQKRGGGSIVNISSIGGIRPEPLLGVYSMSKAALISLTKVLADESGPARVRVNVVCPGLIQTKFSRALWENEEGLKQFVSHLPLRRIAQSEEVAPLVLFLASDAAGYCTGGVYTVDGGHTA